MLFFICILIFEMVITDFLPANMKNDSTAITCILINSCAIIFLLSKSQKYYNDGKKSNFEFLVMISYILRVIFMFWDKYCRNIFIFPNSGLDTGTFDHAARAFLSGKSVDGYGRILGYIYKLFYPNTLWGQYINILAAILTIYILKKILDMLDIHLKYKSIGAYLICFLPNYLIMSAILLRESFITLFLAVSIWQFLKWWKSGNKLNLVLSLVVCYGAVYLHTGTIAYAVAIIIIFILTNNKKREFQVTLKNIFILILFIICFFIYYSNSSDDFGYLSGVNSVSDISNKAASMNSGGSGYSISIVPDDTMLGMIINSPFRIFFFLASPLPWYWRGINDIIAFLFSAFFYTISIYYSFKAIKLTSKNKNIIICLLIFAISSAFIYSWGVSNAGTALRHRDKFLPNFILLFIIASDAIVSKRLQLGSKQ
ncbi:hypothetical protein [Thomasclavelia cocleata]|uniref:hypothetical protein n=2 Tax=Thomasclavelia cocleata TaxID=69824 RepID=UPI002584F710|nr:hypothetical protein [Thomasclavelia cocleata]